MSFIVKYSSSRPEMMKLSMMKKLSQALGRWRRRRIEEMRKLVSVHIDWSLAAVSIAFGRMQQAVSEAKASAPVKCHACSRRNNVTGFLLSGKH